jgi:tetratricopeptide (TPR) repeat protein
MHTARFAFLLIACALLAAPSAASAQNTATASAVDTAQLRNDAARAMRWHDWYAAREAWDALLAELPDDPAALLGRGTCLLMAGEQTAADADFTRLLAATDGAPETLADIGAAYRTARMAGTARTYYERAAAAADTAQFTALAASAMVDDGNPHGALSLLRPVRETATTEPQVALALARAYTATGELAQAAAAWADARAAHPGDYDVTTAAGRYYLDRGNNTAAAESYRLAIAADPAHYYPRVRLAEALLAAGDAATALAELEAALAADPAPQVKLALAKLLSDTGTDATRVEQLWRELLRDHPQQVDVLFANGRRLYQKGSIDAAKAEYLRGQELFPRDSRFLNGLGSCAYSTGDFAAAADYYRQALALEFDPTYAGNLAGALHELGRGAEVEALWAELHQQHPGDPRINYQYGLSLLSTRDYAGAYSQFAAALDIVPESAEYHNRAGLAAFRLEEYGVAAEHFAAALALSNQADYATNLALAEQQAGNMQAAKEAFRTAIDLDPGNAKLRERYIDLLVAEEDYNAALTELRKQAEATPTADAYARLARLLKLAGEPQQALSAFRSARELAPDAEWLNLEYALTLAELRNEEELHSHMSWLHDQYPTQFISAVNELANYWLDEGMYETSLRFMEQLLDYAPDEADIHNYLALSLAFMGDRESARAAVRHGLTTAGDSFFGRYLEAQLTSSIDGTTAALPLAEKLLTHPEANEQAYLLYLELASTTTSSTELLATAREGLNANPDSVDLLSFIALELYSAGQAQEVVRLLTAERYADADWEQRSEVLGAAYLDAGNYVKAEASLMQAVEQNAEYPGLWALLGEAQFFAGRLGDARTSLTQSLAIEPGHPRALVWLGYVLLEQGELDGAESSIAQAEAAEYVPLEVSGWAALGLARIAIERDDYTRAQQLVNEAEMYEITLARFESALAEVRRLLGH